MSLFKDVAVTLRRIDYSETSQVVELFSREQGKQRLIAKGIKRSTRKRVAPGIDLLENGQAVWSRREGSEASLGLLTDWRQLDAFTGLRERLDRLYGAQYAAEIVSLLTEDGDPHPPLYDDLVRTLTSLSGADNSLEHVVTFQLSILREVGLLPSFSNCVACGRPASGRNPAYLSSTAGGLLCPNCEPAHVEKRRATAKAIAGLIGQPWTPAGLTGAFDLLDYHIAYTIGRSTRLGPWVVPIDRRADRAGG